MLEPFASAPPHIQLHAFSATIAVVIGPFALFAKRRGTRHKVLGYIWVIAMLTVATTAFFIHSFAVIGPYSPIHGFAILTYWSIWTAMRAVFAGRIMVHQQAMRSLYFNGLVIAGVANFLPGRMTNRAFFGQTPELGYLVIAIGVLLLVAYWARRSLAGPSRTKSASMA